MLVQGAFNLLFRPGLRKDFRDTFQEYEPEYPYFLKTGTIGVPEISASIITGMNRLIEIDDGEAVTYEDPKMGPKVSAVDKEFALGFILSRKTVEDDQYGKANQGAKWLAHAARMTSEYRSAALLDDAFTGSVYKGIDGKSLCNTAHTLINSSTTVANTPTTQVGMSVTGITALLDIFMQMKDENGDPVRMMPNKLIIGNNSTDLHKAMQILGSDREPFTADNQDNAIKKRIGGMKPYISHYKSSAKSYFMIDDKYNDAHYLTRRPVTFDDTFDFDTRAAKYRVDTRFLIWFVDWKGWAGMNPS